jgi:hypothetical protein
MSIFNLPTNTVAPKARANFGLAFAIARVLEYGSPLPLSFFVFFVVPH